MVASRRRRWVVGACAFVILAAASAVAWEVRYGTWATLHRAADRFEPPDGFVEVHREDQGTAFCVISCDEARVVVLYQIDLEGDDACAGMVEAAAEIAPPRETPLVSATDFCGGNNPLPGTDGQGSFAWSVMRGQDLAEDPYFVYQSLGPLASGIDGLVAIATFDSGID